MAGFVKIFSSILDSTVWDCDNPTRIVWITLLAMADSKGRVTAAITGIARRARVSLDEAKSALDVLASPDEHSMNKENEGRRIEIHDRGVNILNYRFYRELLGNGGDRNEYQRVKQAEYREKKKQTKEKK
jgi:hypothetical protein